MNIKNYDAIIVLANLMNSKGVLNSESRARAIKAANIFKNSSSKLIITCGWDYRNDSNIKIANAFKSFLINRMNIKATSIISQTESRDTVGDAYFTKIKYAKPMSLRELCIVTSDYHVARTKEIFEFIYGSKFKISVCGVSINKKELKLNNELVSLEAFRKTFINVEAGNDKKILNALRRYHPFYNGIVYKKI
jgi:uncharacterized SAM-binding protein YcdF (DUF218 family)